MHFQHLASLLVVNHNRPFLILYRDGAGAGYFILGVGVYADDRIGVGCAHFYVIVGKAGACDNGPFANLNAVAEHVVFVAAVAGCVPA